MAEPNISASEVDMACHNTEVGNVMLKSYEHDGRKRYYPQKGVTIIGACGKVTGPIAWVNKANGDEKTRSDILKNVNSAEYSLMVAPL